MHSSLDEHLYEINYKDSRDTKNLTLSKSAFTFVLIIVRYFLQKNFLQVRDSTTKVHR
jgi:hypothetical protein